VILPPYVIPSSMVVCYGVFFVAMRTPTIQSMRARLQEKKAMREKKKKKAKPGGSAKN